MDDWNVRLERKQAVESVCKQLQRSKAAPKKADEINKWQTHEAAQSTQQGSVPRGPRISRTGNRILKKENK